MRVSFRIGAPLTLPGTCSTCKHPLQSMVVSIANAVVENYETGLPPAVIARYFSLDLRQVEALIRYYLAHRPDIDPPQSREPVPPLVAALARKIWESAYPGIPGDSALVDAEGSPSSEGACWWIATHTKGDPIIEDQTPGTSGQGLREFFDAYQADGRSTVIGTIEDGRFTTITRINNQLA
jgi:hypothetical protein